MLKLMICGILAMITLACAPTQIWISTPVKQTYSSEQIYVEFEPQKKSQTFYDAFLITITNKTDQQLVIDWNRTRYLLNGNVFGRFGFEGITQENVDAPPPDQIPPGKTLSKLIFPLNLIARRPLRSTSASSAAFRPGPLPAGQSGIALVLTRDTQLIQPTLTVDIRIETK